MPVLFEHYDAPQGVLVQSRHKPDRHVHQLTPLGRSGRLSRYAHLDEQGPQNLHATDASGKYSPILPFLGVLLRGRDAPLLASGSAVPAYHPSVGYARDVYVAIAMNAFVDLLGFTYLFHAYLATWDPPWVAWVIGASLGAVFSIAFGTFATSLVRKPLSRPTFRRTPVLIGGGAIAVGVLLLMASSYLPAIESFGGIAIALGVATLLVSTFGFQDGSLVFTRATVMFGVGYLVAGPLHEAMFHKEIDRSYRGIALTEVDEEVARQDQSLAAVRAERFETCMRSRQELADPTCSGPRAASEQAALLVQAITFVKEQEVTGNDGAANRTFLVDRAKEVGATGVVALLGTGGTGRPGTGPRYQQAVTMEPEARRAATAAAAAETSCLEAAATCEQAVATDPRIVSLQGRLEELQRQAEELRTGAIQPGPIERALALDALVAGTTGAGGSERASVLHGKLLAAWFLAMVMPIIVLVMKASAGDKLEPYLRRRWAGR